MAKDLQELVDCFAEMGDRAEDLRPIGDDLDEVWSRNQARFLRLNPIGSMENLGPSIQNPGHGDHVFRMKKKGFEAGTSVPYADNYRKIQRRQILNTDAATLTDIGQTVCDYIAGAFDD